MNNRRFIRSVTAALLLLLSFLSVVHPPLARGDNLLEYEPGQLVAKVNTLLGDIQTLNTTYGTTTIDSLMGRDDIFLLAVPTGSDPAQLAATMSLDPLVEYAEPNYTQYSPEAHTDRSYAWGGSDTGPLAQQSTDMQLDDSHAIGRGTGTIVAVLDTGVQLDHPLLVDRLTLVQYDFVENDTVPADEPDGVDDDGDGVVDESVGHGTHVAGIAHQVAPEASIMPLRILNSDGRGNSFWTAEAILFAASNGADVVNLSLGSSQPSALLKDMVEEVAASGVVVVAAAGNMGADVKQYPAAEACAIAVASIDRQNHKSSFSNYGDWIDIATLGESIYSAVPINSYAWWSGTSMATPIIAGQAALLRGVDRGMTLDEIGLLLGGTALPIDSGDPTYRSLLGAGRADIYSSLTALVNGTSPESDANLFGGCN